MTAGSFSAARANEEGETRFLQTDDIPHRSAGRDGYVVAS